MEKPGVCVNFSPVAGAGAVHGFFDTDLHEICGCCKVSKVRYFDGLGQGCSISSVLAMEILQSCIKPSISVQAASGKIVTMLCSLKKAIAVDKVLGSSLVSLVSLMK